jgi:hypothetical protein
MGDGQAEGAQESKARYDGAYYDHVSGVGSRQRRERVEHIVAVIFIEISHTPVEEGLWGGGEGGGVRG